MKPTALALVAVLSTSAACATARPDFDAALSEHLRTVTERDLPAYERTITSRDELSIIFPNGHRSTTRKDALAFHSGWFADTKWQMRFEEAQRLDYRDTIVVLLHTYYRDTPDGPDREGWLTVTFALEDGAWRLVHDQNTRIAPKTAPE